MPITRPVPRRPVRDVQLGAWRIPAGALVNSMVGTVLRSGSFWTNPDRFDPDRFSHDRAEDRDHKALFSPFGCGAHAGIGMHLATVAAKAFWHTMLTRCSFRLEPDYDARHTYAPLGIVSGDVKLVVDAV
jgi:cytochrome P450